MAEEKDGDGCGKADVIYPGEPAADGRTPYVRHRPDHTVEIGVMARPKDGQPIQELVQLSPRDSDGGFDVTTVHSSRKGPSKVATDGYRSGWDRMWGSTPDRGLN
jgi:hypothetical protein